MGAVTVGKTLNCLLRRERIAFAHVVSRGLHRPDDLVGDLRSADAAERSGDLPCFCRVAAVQQKPQHVRRVANARQHDLSLDGISG